MKRSEMINLIRNNLMEILGEPDGISLEPNIGLNLNITLFEIIKKDKQISDNLLTLMELSGMLPPGYMKPIPFESDGRQYPLIPGDFPNDQRIWCTPGVNEWEPE